MKYLAVEYSAAKEIVSSNTLQSADFRDGENFAVAIKTNPAQSFSHSIKMEPTKNGSFLFANNCDKSKLLIFDLSLFDGFQKSDQEAITIIQKCCRVAIKMWDKIGGFSPREKYIHGSNKIVLFPLNFAVGNPYKVLLDKSPDSKRQHKRGTERYLIYWSGYGEFNQSPVLANMRKAEEEINHFSCEQYFSELSAKNGSDRYLSVETTSAASNKFSPHMGMEFWEKNLTQTQRNFVFTDRLGPDILKGAAGTGKTLCLVLRCIHQLREHKELNKSIKAVLFTHSIASKEAIENLIVTNGGEEFLSNNLPQSLLIATLQEWCINNLGSRISATEYLDKDALESKNTQLLYISDAYDDFLREDFQTSKKFISRELTNFVKQQDAWGMSTYLQHEISVYIKGRAGEEYDVYRKLKRRSTSIPLSTDDDFSTIFHIFTKYQKKLLELNLFDSDDITISALQETSTPIWRRRRIKDGFDVLYIDETHLFNENELSLFHNLLKQNSTNIVFTIDRSQAVGDTSVSPLDISKALGDTKDEEKYGFGTVFRSTTEIIDLADCVLASGSAIFTNLENPLLEVAGNTNANSNDKCVPPYLVECPNRTSLYSLAYTEVDKIASQLKVRKSEVIIVPANDELVSEIKEWGCNNGRDYVTIERRGDIEAVKTAESESKYLIGGMDYIGGLEFSAVVIVGADSDKFPPRSRLTGETSHYLLYASYNRLYVAITRARCVVAILSESTKGISETLAIAIEHGLLHKQKES